MTEKSALYDRYTSTAALPSGVDQDGVLRWSKNYFKVHYSDLLPLKKSAKILDVGCGYGKYLVALSELGFTDTYGIDLSDEQILHAKSKLQLSNVEHADALNWLQGKEAVFDCILGLDILEHLSTDDLVVLGGLIHRALKPGGTVIFQVPNGMSPLNPIVYGDFTHVRAFTPQSMQQFLLHTGFLPNGYFEIPPHVHGIKSAVQRLIWQALMKPTISALVLALHGRQFGGGIYTSNFIGSATK